ncbi:hypothetical protein GCM10025794_37950 [Massilia kyonggiensis]|jgi:hypothetical protein
MTTNARETDECGRCGRKGITEAGDEGAGEMHSMGGEDSEASKSELQEPSLTIYLHPNEGHLSSRLLLLWLSDTNIPRSSPTIEVFAMGDNLGL